jgi:hypothetical protein
MLPQKALLSCATVEVASHVEIASLSQQFAETKVIEANAIPVSSA